MTSAADRLAPILQLLRSADAQERRDGILELMRSGDPMAEAILVRLAAADPSVEIRYYARRALDSLTSKAGTSAEESAISDQPVHELLVDPDPRVRFAGIRAALAQGGAPMVDLLRAGLARESVPHLQAAFITVLGRIGGADELALLTPYLQNPEPRLRANAVEALAMIGTEAAFSRLIPIMQDEDNRVRANVLKALQAYGGAPLFQLLRRMSLEGEIWMRDSALYALSRFKTPQALLVIGHIAGHDPLERLRIKARQIIELLAARGNKAAAELLLKLGMSGLSGPTAPEPDSPAVSSLTPEPSPSAGPPPFTEFPGVPESPADSDDSVPAADDSDLSELLAHDDPACRQLGILRLAKRALSDDVPLLTKALADEKEPFLLAALVAIARDIKSADLFSVLLPLLKHVDDRVRANAVEAITSIDQAASSGHLFELLDDSNNRVRGNVLLALAQDGIIDPFDALKTMANDARGYWRRTALYVISSLRQESLLPLLEQLLEDAEQKVRDVAFEVVKEFALAGIPGAKSLQGRIMTRIRMERSRGRFFENTFDEIFSDVIDAVKAEEEQTDDRSFSLNRDRERAALCALARKPAAKSLIPAVFFAETKRVKAEVERFDGVIREAERLASQAESISLEAGVKARAEVELLQLQRKRLTERQDTILAEAGAKVLEKARKLPTGSRLALNPELEKAANSLTEHVPWRAFSVLPDDEANVPELFDLSMRVYQKHVLSFSGVSLLAGGVFLVLLLFEFIIGTFCFEIHPFLGLLALIPLLFAATGQYLVLFSLWTIQVTIMMSHFVHGRSPSFREVFNESLPLLFPLILTNFKRYCFLAGWLVAAGCATLPLLGVAEYIEGMFYLETLLNLLAIILFVAIFGMRYFPYLLVEPSFILGRGKDSDPFTWALQAFNRAPFRLIFLHVFAMCMMKLISGTTQQLLGFMTVVPIGHAIMIGIALLSEICLTPMAYSTIVIYAMIQLREENSSVF